MIAVHLEPRNLPANAIAVADWRPNADYRADAIRGSRRLRNAVLRLQRPKRRRTFEGRPRTWAARKIARARVMVILQAAADYFKLTAAALTGSRGPAETARSRQIAMYLSRELTTASYADIGYCFGGRDHSTVFHACREIALDTASHQYVAELRERLAA